MEVKIENGKLVITLPMQAATPSASGKTLLVATTHGSVKTSCLVDGKPVTVAVNAYIPR